ncbi:unnamed protein product, partial [Laminaria digitata]
AASSAEDTINNSVVDGYDEGQLGFVESHGFEPIAGAAAAAVVVEAEGPPSSAIARRRLRQLECSWLEDPGKDVPFEFAEMRQAAPLPCSIQLVPRAERGSLVYVDGKESTSRRAANDAYLLGGGGSSGRSRTGGNDRSGSSSRGGSSSSSSSRGGSSGRNGSSGRSSSSSRSSSSGSSSSSSRGAGGAMERKRGRGGSGAGEGVWAEGGGGGGRGAGGGRRRDAIRLVGEMDISKPAYLHIHEGEDGRADTLLVSQFGLTRGGAVSRVDLDPSPRFMPGVPPPLEAAGRAPPPRPRTQPRLLGEWGGPLLWPNEINQVQEVLWLSAW